MELRDRHVVPEVIGPFLGRWRFLSNFYPVTVVMDQVAYRSVEHAYQAAKTLDVDERRIIAAAETPGAAKKFGRMVTVREDWEQVKLTVMLNLLTQKFSLDPLATWLVETAPARLVEINTWGDTFWGICQGHGENHLGRLLMRVRAALLEGQPLRALRRDV